MGHGMEMAEASGVALHIEYEKIPLVNCAHKYAEMGAFPGGAFDNRGYYSGKIRLSGKVDEPAEMLLYDPQTSGGLLLGVPPEKLDAFMKRAQETDQPTWVIGNALEGSGIEIA